MLEAAVDCLVEYGYFGLTTSKVADQAGVSRGALLHQYPTRQELVVAAVEHLAVRRAAELREAAGRLPAGTDRTAAALSLLWSQFSGRLFQAGVELMVAGRTDAELRTTLLPFDRELRRLSKVLFADLFGPSTADHPAFREVVTLVLNTMYGVALQRLLQPTASIKRQQELLENVVATLLSSPRRQP